MDEDRKIQIKNFMKNEFDIEIGDKYIEMYDEALTHYNDEREKGTRAPERLVFLGDAYLEFAVRKYLFDNEDDFSIGYMDKWKQSVVNNEKWGDIAKQIGLNEQIVTMQHGKRVERVSYNTKPLARSFEALAAVIYLDSNVKNPDDKLIDLFIKLGSFDNLQKNPSG